VKWCRSRWATRSWSSVDGAGPLENRLAIDVVAVLLYEVPVDLELHGDRTGALHRQVMATADVVGPAWLRRGSPTGLLQGVDRPRQLGGTHQQIHVVDRTLVEALVDPVEQIEPFEHQRRHSGPAQQVQGLLRAGKQQHVVGADFGAQLPQPVDRLGSHQAGPAVPLQPRVDPGVHVGEAAKIDEAHGVHRFDSHQILGALPLTQDDRDENPYLMVIVHEGSRWLLHREARYRAAITASTRR
jgi:hypothetical protein